MNAGLAQLPLQLILAAMSKIKAISAGLLAGLVAGIVMTTAMLLLATLLLGVVYGKLVHGQQVTGGMKN